MESREAKQRLLDIFGAQIKFNKKFDVYAAKLKESMLDDFIEWCKRCKENRELGSVPKKKEFKSLYIFFRKIGTDIRAVLIKEQNKDFIEIILDGHKAYDDVRLKLGYKKSSYYGS